MQASHCWPRATDTVNNLSFIFETCKADFRSSYGKTPGGYCHIWAIQVCAAVKGMVFKQFTLA